MYNQVNGFRIEESFNIKTYEYHYSRHIVIVFTGI